MKLKEFFSKHEKLIKNILNLILFFIILVILFFCYKFIEIKFELQSKLKIEKLNDVISNKNKEIKELKKELFLSKIDLLSDNSITKFVNNKVSFFDLWYVPEDLVSVSGEYIVDSKNWYIKVRKELKDALDALSKQFYKDTNNNIVIVSWYRSYNYQNGIKKWGCPDSLCAKAWYSEHQSGLAIDIYSASSEKNWFNDNNLRKYFSWFKDNAYKYGFHNTYQKWLETDWYEIEPWHWRYIWPEFAKYLYDNNITFAEFYKKNTK